MSDTKAPAVTSRQPILELEGTVSEVCTLLVLLGNHLAREAEVSSGPENACVQGYINLTSDAVRRLSEQYQSAYEEWRVLKGHKS